MVKSIDCFTCSENKTIHTDLCRPIGLKSVGGSSYLIMFIDDYSRYIFTYFLRQKGDAFDVFVNVASLVE